MAEEQLSGDLTCDSSSTSSIEMESTNTELQQQVAAKEEMMAEAGSSENSNPTPGKMMMEEEELGAAGGAASGVENAIDRLLERNKNEIMFELRKLKMGDRPVTGQGNKEAVEGFFQRALDSNNGVPVSTEEHRPDAVVVEVQGLVERRPVSSLLQSFNFRRQLESAIRSSIVTVTSRESPATSRQQSSPAPSGAAAPAPRQESAIPQPPAAAPRPATRLRQREPVNIADAHRAVGQAAAQAARALRARQAEIPTPPPLPTENVAAPPAGHIPTPPPLPHFEDLAAEPSGTQRAEAWLQQQPFPAQENGDPSLADMWGNIRESHREYFIGEISELIQRQLVTSSLDSTFRTHLESHVAARLEQTGTNGARVANFVRTLPPSGHTRNDFSDLGIGAPMAASISDNLDEVSVISATAAVHVAQNHVPQAVNRELHSLRSQIAELKSMMRLSFDLQLDIQRAIRQEVAAAVSQAFAGATVPAPAATQPVNDDNCLICLDKSTDTVLYQCGHMCVCYTCGLQLKQRGAHCPMCRAPIRDIIRAYRNNTQ